MDTLGKLKMINRYCGNSISITCYKTSWTLSAFDHRLFEPGKTISAITLEDTVEKAYQIVESERLTKQEVEEYIENENPVIADHLIFFLRDQEDEDMPLRDDLKDYVNERIKEMYIDSIEKDESARYDKADKINDEREIEKRGAKL